MKTLCGVIIVVLSLTSVCQPASLTCEKLLKPVDKGPDFSGTWYVIAISSDACLIPAFFNAFFWPSVAIEFTSKDTPNTYDVVFKANMFGYCSNESSTYFIGNNTAFEVDSNNAPTDDKLVLLPSGCPDCFVTRDSDIINALLFLSRRKNVTAAELKEFETQTDCLGWYKPQVLNSEHEYDNCKSLDNDDDDNDEDNNADARIFQLIYQRMKKTYVVPFSCFSEKMFYYPRVAFEWAQQTLDSLW